jgi:adenine-specific DNA methylase
MTKWHSKREVIVNTFGQHNFAFCWSYPEMAALVVGSGYEWAMEKTGKCVKELCALVRHEDGNARVPTLPGRASLPTRLSTFRIHQLISS